MKSRKKILSTLMGVALTSQMLPSTYTIVANAQTPSVTTVIERQGQNSENEEAQGQAKNGLDNMIIALLGVGCDEGTHKFEIRFNTKTMKLEPKIACGRGFGYGGVHPFHPYFGDNPYVTITLLDQFGNVKKEFSLRGNASVEEAKELENWSFEYGYRLRIKHREADWRVKFYGSVTDPKGKPVEGLNNKTSQETLATYDFQITPSGLKEVQKNVVEISDKKALINTLQNSDQKTIRLQNDITITEEDLINLTPGYNGKELIIKDGVSIDGNGRTINFQGKASLTLTGNNISLSNLKVRFCTNIGMQIYDSDNVYLKNVTVEDAEKYGLVVNASSVTLEDCTTRNNKSGGIYVTRSITLQGDNYKDSEVNVIGSLNQYEDNRPKILIQNFQMLNGIMQDNTFIPAPNQSYTTSENNEPITLTNDYCDILGVDHGTKINQQTIEYR